MQTLESTHYVAKPAHIEALARDLLDATTRVTGGRDTYLKALVGTTQDDLGIPPRLRTPRGVVPEGGIDKAAQLKALEEVHSRFYAVLQRVLYTEDIAEAPRLSREERRRRRLERNRRVGFARSAVSTLRGWLRVEGHDLGSLVADKVTKHVLASSTPGRRIRRVGVEVLQKRTERASGKLADAIEALIAKDPEIAARQLEASLGRLSSALAALGRVATKDATLAVDELRPLRVGRNVFWPMAGEGGSSRLQ